MFLFAGIHRAEPVWRVLQRVNGGFVDPCVIYKHYTQPCYLWLVQQNLPSWLHLLCQKASVLRPL